MPLPWQQCPPELPDPKVKHRLHHQCAPRKVSFPNSMSPWAAESEKKLVQYPISLPSFRWRTLGWVFCAPRHGSYWLLLPRLLGTEATNCCQEKKLFWAGPGKPALLMPAGIQKSWFLMPPSKIALLFWEEQITPSSKSPIWTFFLAYIFFCLNVGMDYNCDLAEVYHTHKHIVIKGTCKQM